MRQYRKTIQLSPDAYLALSRYSWPGNVRELMHFIERLVISAGEPVVSGGAIAKFLENREYDPETPQESVALPAEQTSEDVRILSALESNRYNIKKTAQVLGISRPTLYRKLKLYNIQIKKTL